MLNPQELIDYPHIFGHHLGYTDLIPLHGEWIHRAWTEDSYKALQAHRNSYKTTSILIVGAIWYLLFCNPDATILFLRKSETEVQKILATIRDHLESPAVLAIVEYLHGVKSLKTSRWSTSSLAISIKKSKTPEGSIDVRGATGNITGAHYDFIFPDDLITKKDRYSKAERESTKSVIRELVNILRTGGKIFYSGTPWERNDGWSIIPPPDKYPIGSVPIPGFREHELPAKIAELKKDTASLSLYTANYELRHIADEDRLFPDPVFGDWPEGLQTIAYLDPAYSGTNNTAITVGGKHGGRVYARGWTWRKNVIDIYSDIVDILRSCNVGTLYIESNADKGLSARDLGKLWPSVKPIHESENKHIKIVGYAVRHSPLITWAHDTDMTYLGNAIEYQEGQEPDDEADSLAGLMRELGFSGHSKIVSIPAVSLSDMGL